ncbi:MAG: gephyrin-like molybdotransferase Glp [Sedimentisphaerales bacterium]
MLKFDDAFEIVMRSACRLGTERVDIDCALNRVLAEDVVSDIDIPLFNKSAMDGFACRRADLANELTVIETVPAGTMPKRTIGQNQCAKIMTGAVVPEGADCVIMVEYTQSVTENRIRFIGKDGTDNRAATVRERIKDVPDNICLKGEDIKKGDVVLRAGQLLKPQHIAVLASVGCVQPVVSLQPRVGIIATGDELVEPSEKPAAYQIRNSNGLQLAAQVARASAIATNYGKVGDTKEAIEAMLKRAMIENDVVIVSGGVSVGDYDLVRQILQRNSVKLLFEKVATKPGRPTVFGIYSSCVVRDASCETLRDTQYAIRDTKFVFGLPGNPVSTFVMFELLVKPFLFKMMGHDFKPTISHRQLEKTITRKKTERDTWLPVVFTDDDKVAKIEYHGSAHINALCKADGLICIPAGTEQIKEGNTVAVRQI